MTPGRRWLAVLAFCGMLSPALWASESWETRVDADGIKVQIRDVPGSDFKAFRGEMMLSVSPEAVFARLSDTAAYPDWFPDTVEARPLVLDGGVPANYVRTDVPWPLKDRDAIYTQNTTRQADSIRIDIGVAPDALPPVDGVVRVQAAAGSWDLAARADGGTHVVWEFHLEPGGAVPSSLANKRVVETPKRALLGLRAFFEE